MTLLGTLAEFAVAESARREAGVLHHARRAVLDWCAAVLPGSRSPPTPQLLRAHHDELGVGRCSIVGAGTTAFPATAAWINGSAAHAIEYDDIYREAILHPGAPVVAAALAMAEHQGASGGAFLAAIVSGYEVCTRIGAAIQPSHVRRFHATGTVGMLGAATAAAVLAAPGDATAVRHALANATTFAAGLQQALRSDAMTKPLHSGHAATTGVRVAQAAARGLTGADDMLEGPWGLGAVMAEVPDWRVATQGLGETYNITRITHKLHACCGHLFPAIDAVLALRDAHRLNAAAVASIHVTTYGLAIEATGNPDPRTTYEAKFSLPYAVAHALVHGAVALDAFDAQRLHAVDIRALMHRCRMSTDDEMSRAFPSRRCARVVVTLLTGEQFVHELSHRRGDPEAPLADSELEAKFDALCAPVIGADATRSLRDRIWRLGELGLNEVPWRQSAAGPA